jgi:hypothetical protein
MKTQSEIQALKQISIIGFLAGRGIYPTSKSGSCYKYFSPLRQENTASFSVCTKRNTFVDFGNPDKGNASIIDLVKLMDKVGFLDACKILEEFDGKKTKNWEDEIFCFFTVNTLENCSDDNESGKVIIEEVKPLSNKSLINYAESRMIPFHLANKYLCEAYFRNNGKYAKNGKPFYALGFKSDKGGFELRSQNFKGCNSPKTITTIEVPESENIVLFEGFFNFLSALAFYKTDRPKYTTIILNSISFLDVAIPRLTTAKKVYSYLDLDEKGTGQKATQKLIELGLNVSDESKLYKGYNDFNNFLTNKPPATQNAKQTKIPS